MLRRILVAVLPLLVLAVGCAGAAREPAAPGWTVLASSFQAGGQAGPSAACGELATVARPAPARLVAIGDVHGDLSAARAALRLAGAIDRRDRWVGGELAVVQLGDVLDRGDDEGAIIDLFERLEGEAAAAGGSFTWLLGNHELMNAAGDFRYVTRRALRALGGGPGGASARLAAMAPGGEVARIFSGQDVVAHIGDSLFAHAGLTPRWAGRIAAINRDARCWLEGQAPRPALATADDGPVWTRMWGADQVDCAALDRVLAASGARRMVVAHTPQRGGVTSACGGRLWRVDTGMAGAYGGPVQALELSGARPRILGAR